MIAFFLFGIFCAATTVKVWIKGTPSYRNKSGDLSSLRQISYSRQITALPASAIAYWSWLIATVLRNYGRSDGHHSSKEIWNALQWPFWLTAVFGILCALSVLVSSRPRWIIPPPMRTQANSDN